MLVPRTAGWGREGGPSSHGSAAWVPLSSQFLAHQECPVVSLRSTRKPGGRRHQPLPVGAAEARTAPFTSGRSPAAIPTDS